MTAGMNCTCREYTPLPSPEPTASCFSDLMCSQDRRVPSIRMFCVAIARNISIDAESGKQGQAEKRELQRAISTGRKRRRAWADLTDLPASISPISTPWCSVSGRTLPVAGHVRIAYLYLQSLTLVELSENTENALGLLRIFSNRHFAISFAHAIELKWPSQRQPTVRCSPRAVRDALQQNSSAQNKKKIFDRLMVLLGRRPCRCLDCRKRFYLSRVRAQALHLRRVSRPTAKIGSGRS